MSKVIAGNIKEQNQEKMILWLKDHPGSAKGEIAAGLGLSMPTTLNLMNDLLERGVVCECGILDSTGGRRAKKLELNRDHGYSIGINLAIHHTELAVMNFAGELIHKRTFVKSYEDRMPWYAWLHEQIMLMLDELKLEPKKIAGVGISFPGIVDMDADLLVRSHILKIEHVSLDLFYKYIPFDLIVCNDANCAAYADIRPEMEDYIYLSLNESVGGALIFHGEPILGSSNHCGELGHMILVPHGKQCYCGKYGCADPYLTPNVLTERYGDLPAFFAKLKTGEEEAVQIWEDYLEHLVIMVTNLRMIHDCNIVIGGDVGAGIAPYLSDLKDRCLEYDLFSRDIDYLHSCRITESACVTGAARLALERFRRNLIIEYKEKK